MCIYTYEGKRVYRYERRCINIKMRERVYIYTKRKYESVFNKNIMLVLKKYICLYVCESAYTV